MGNGQLKPACNLQQGGDSEYVTWLTVGPQPADTTALIPFLKDAQEHLKFKYKNITADVGYESEENYVFLETNGQISYIKPANYEKSKHGSTEMTPEEPKTWSIMWNLTPACAGTAKN